MTRAARFCASENAAAGVAHRCSIAGTKALLERARLRSLTEGGFVILDRTFMGLTDMLDWQTRPLTARENGGEYPLACLRPERTREVDPADLQRSRHTGAVLVRRFAGTRRYRDDEMVDTAGTLTAVGGESDARRSAG